MAVITILGEKKEYANGTTFEKIAEEYQNQYNNTIALVSENGKIRELHKKVSKDAAIDFITLSNPIGHKTYERSAIMLLVKAVYDVMGSEVRIKVEFSIGKGVSDGLLQLFDHLQILLRGSHLLQGNLKFGRDICIGCLHGLTDRVAEGPPV